MSVTSPFSAPFSTSERVGIGRYAALTGVALVLCMLPWASLLPEPFNPLLIAAGISIVLAMSATLIQQWLRTSAQTRALSLLWVAIRHDALVSFVTCPGGEILVRNNAADQRFPATTGERLDVCLRSVIANPAALLFRLQSRARRDGYATEDVTSRGGGISVWATHLEDDLYLWHIDLNAPQIGDSIDAPVLTVGRNGAVLRSNAPANRLFGDAPDALEQVLAGNDFEEGQVFKVDAPEGPHRMVAKVLSANAMTRNVLMLPLAENPSAGGRTASLADLPVPLLRLTCQGAILEANPLATELVGEVTSGQTKLDDLMQGLGHPVGEWLRETAETDAAPRSEFLRIARKDKEIFVQVTLSRHQRDGEVDLIAILNDATELKTLEAQFVQGQKMQAVGQLAGGVAHDFNNLLTAISGHCDLLLLRHDQNDPNYGDLVQINQNANRAAALVSQLLAFSRKQTLRPEVLDLRDTISDLIHLLNRLVGEKIRLVLSHDPVVKPVRADKRQLEQVLMNLVVNARDAMPDGGDIRIETEVASLDRPLTRDRATVPGGEYVTVKVSDSGIGIPADKLQKVFEPFYTTKRTGEGTGLGLSTVYGIVKQTGGFIFVDSVVGRGTEFTVFLPVCTSVEVREPETLPAPQPSDAAQGEGVILLVEDEAPVRAFATRALRLKGFTVIEAGSAEEALSLLEDPHLSVDLFVTDVVMPGMDGPTWVRKAMETRPEVRVVFMSGYTEGVFGESGPQVANSGFLPKPFSLTQLTEAVFRQLN